MYVCIDLCNLYIHVFKFLQVQQRYPERDRDREDRVFFFFSMSVKSGLGTDPVVGMSSINSSGAAAAGCSSSNSSSSSSTNGAGGLIQKKKKKEYTISNKLQEGRRPVYAVSFNFIDARYHNLFATAGGNRVHFFASIHTHHTNPNSNPTFIFYPTNLQNRKVSITSSHTKFPHNILHIIVILHKFCQIKVISFTSSCSNFIRQSCFLL